MRRKIAMALIAASVITGSMYGSRVAVAESIDVAQALAEAEAQNSQEDESITEDQEDIPDGDQADAEVAPESDAAPATAYDVTEAVPAEGGNFEDEGTKAKASREIKDAAKTMTAAVQVGEKVFEIGKATAKDLIDAGAKAEGMDGNVVIDPGKEKELHLDYNESSLDVTVRNTGEKQAMANECTVVKVYASGDEVFAAGGIRTGYTVDDLTGMLADPYKIEEGTDFTDTDYIDGFSNIQAYEYASRWDDVNMIFYVDEDAKAVISFEEKEPAGYIYSVDQISEDAVKRLVEDFEKGGSQPANAAPTVTAAAQGAIAQGAATKADPLKNPKLINLNSSSFKGEYATGYLTAGSRANNQAINYDMAMLYLLQDSSKLGDAESIEDYVPKSCLVIEYHATYNYTDEELEHFKLLGMNEVASEYQVAGGFYVLDPMLDAEGNIVSGVGEKTARPLEGAYIQDEERDPFGDKILDAVMDFILPDGVNADNYSKNEKIIAVPSTLATKKEDMASDRQDPASQTEGRHEEPQEAPQEPQEQTPADRDDITAPDDIPVGETEYFAVNPENPNEVINAS